MAADDVAAVAYLWDGSQPGWRLRVSHRHERRIVLHFGPSGPSVQELAAMREVFAELRGRTAAKVCYQGVYKGMKPLSVAFRAGKTVMKKVIIKQLFLAW